MDLVVEVEHRRTHWDPLLRKTEGKGEHTVGELTQVEPIQ